MGDTITYGANFEDRAQSAYPYLIEEDGGFEVHQIGEALLPEGNAAFQEVIESYENIYLAVAY